MERNRSEKLKDAGVKRYGSEEAWRQAMREFGAMADRTTPRGFAKVDKEKLKEISRSGGYARQAKRNTEKGISQE